jgi:hypothetical protein
MIPFFNKQKRDNLYQLGGGERGGRTKFLTRHEKKNRLINYYDDKEIGGKQ